MSEDSKTKSQSLTPARRTLIPLLPLRDIVVFPSTIVPLFVGREKSIIALERAMNMQKEILLAAQIKAKTNEPEMDEIYDVGTVSTILQLLKLPDGTVKVLVEGKYRAHVDSYVESESTFIVEATPLPEATIDPVEVEALMRTVKLSFDNYVRLGKRLPPEMLISISQIHSESRLSDTLVAHLPNLKLTEKQKLLEETSPAKRLEEIYSYIQSEIEIVRVEKKIRARVKRQMEKSQKEYYLNEQMAAIQRELGDKDDTRTEIQDLENAIQSKKLSDEARQRLLKEVRKLKGMSPMSAEATVVRNYVDMVLSLPWNEFTEDIHNIHFAEQVLDRDHFGLDKVKERILEYLAVKSVVGGLKGPILCLVGPPGVGKTSLARSIAESLGRKFVRVALGGVRDQAEITGHRRTYIGSMPGKVIMSLKKAGSANPLLLLDEIDKLSSDHRGDPSAALLEVLDPEQNKAFNDHYVDLDFDLSKVFFIATANSLEGVPAPLLDRMEIIKLSGYTEIEKVEIAERYLVPKQLKEHGLNQKTVQLPRTTVQELIRYYTKEAGVRNLEREIASLLRKVSRKYLKEQKKENEGKGSSSESAQILANIQESINPAMLVDYLGGHRFRIGHQNEKAEIGLCTGLAWTSVGGDILMIEVAVLPGKGKLTITGKLGDVMQESAQAALSYVRSRAAFLGLESDFYQKVDIHIHVPEGAIPKDGPSAGLCMATSLTSALTSRPISQDVAMTGEITLRGRSLPIGGLKEKSLAAHRGGIKKILFPRENLKDLEDIPKNVLAEIEFVPVEHMDEVLMHSLVWGNTEAQGESDELYNKLVQSTSHLPPTMAVAH